MPPTVSIITPFLNGTQFIPEFISNMTAQTFTDWECLLIDDGSSDDSLCLALQLTSEDPRFFVSRNPLAGSSPGPASARNYGLSHSRGEYIAFCDIDDLWHPLKLSLQLPFQICNNLDITVTGFGRFIHSTDSPVCSLHTPPSVITKPLMFNGNKLPMLTVIAHRRLFASSRFPHCSHEDYSLWLSIFMAKPNLRCRTFPALLAFYRVHSSNLTSRRLKMPLWAFYAFRHAGCNSALSIILLSRWIFFRAFEFLCPPDLFSCPTLRRSSVNSLLSLDPYSL